MGKFIQNKSMDIFIGILTYFDSDTDLIIIDSRFVHTEDKSLFKNTIKFNGKIADFNILKIESGEINFSEVFDIIRIDPDHNKITVYIHEY